MIVPASVGLVGLKTAGIVAVEGVPTATFEPFDVNIIVVRIVYAVMLAPEVAEIGRPTVSTLVITTRFADV